MLPGWRRETHRLIRIIKRLANMIANWMVQKLGMELADSTLHPADRQSSIG